MFNYSLSLVQTYVFYRIWGLFLLYSYSFFNILNSIIFFFDIFILFVVKYISIYSLDNGIDHDLIFSYDFCGVLYRLRIFNLFNNYLFKTNKILLDFTSTLVSLHLYSNFLLDDGIPIEHNAIVQISCSQT